MHDDFHRQFMAWIKREKERLAGINEPDPGASWRIKFEKDLEDFDEAQRILFPKVTPLTRPEDHVSLSHFYRQFWSCYHAVSAIELQCNEMPHSDSYDGIAHLLTFIREHAQVNYWKRWKNSIAFGGIKDGEVDSFAKELEAKIARNTRDADLVVKVGRVIRERIKDVDLPADVHEMLKEYSQLAEETCKAIILKTGTVVLPENVEDIVGIETAHFLDAQFLVKGANNKAQAGKRKNKLARVEKLASQLVETLDELEKPVNGLADDLQSFVTAGIELFANEAHREHANMEPGRRGRPGSDHLIQYVGRLVEVLGLIKGSPAKAVSNSQGYDYQGETLDFVKDCLAVVERQLPRDCRPLFFSDDSLGAMINKYISNPKSQLRNAAN